MKTIATLFLLLPGLLLTTLPGCKKNGCIDRYALNYNEDAKKDDGSCVFGNTNSAIITVTANEWSGGDNGYFVVKQVGIITSEIVGNGAVLCYVKQPDGFYLALPASVWYGTYTWHFNFDYNIGSIRLVTQDSDGMTLNPGPNTFKIVVIKDNILNQYPEVNINDHDQVMDMLTTETQKGLIL